MSRAIVFITPKDLDLRSVTTFGLSVKETDHPIGQFGTGLKYALAILARNGCPVTIWIKGTKWTLERETTNFRGKDVIGLYLQRHTKLGMGKQIALPFTTELGKNWQMWQAFRELESNTRDEGGGTDLFTGEQDELVVNKTGTSIIVEGESFVEEYLKRDEHFLPHALTRPISDGDTIQIFMEPSKYMYYRGIRVRDLEKPSIFTYNILSETELTEDRTVKYDYLMDQIVSAFILKCRNEKIIHDLLTAPPSTYEGSMSFAYSYIKPSEEFLNVTERMKKPSWSGGSYNTTALNQLAIHRPEPPKKPNEPWIDEMLKVLANNPLTVQDQEMIRSYAVAHRERLIEILERATRK